MRKHLIGTILVLAALAACNKEVETPAPAVDNGQEEVTPGKVTLTFKATIDEETRTAYTNDKTASWVDGDAISVCLVKGNSYTVVDFTTQNGTDFSAEVESGYTPVSAIYPANDNYREFQEDYFTDGAVTAVFLPHAYDLAGTNDTGKFIPLVSSSIDGETMTFRHICGALKITVVDIFNALTFTTAGETITGNFPLTNGRIEIPENGSTSTVTFTYGRLQSYIDNGEFGPRDSRTFYIPVPDGTLAGGATMALKNDDDKVVYEKKTSSTNEIAFTSNKTSIKRFPGIGLNLREDWSITPDLSGVNPVITFDPKDNTQLYIRLTTTKATFNSTYHGSVEAF